VKVRFRTYLRAGKKSVGVPGERVRVSGTVDPYAAGQQVEIHVFREGRRVESRTKPVISAGKGRGKFGLWLRPKVRGVYKASVRLAESEAPAAPPSASSSNAATARLFVVRPSAGPGSSGTNVRALQGRMAKLGYLTPVNGFYGASTTRAVLALRKVAGYARNGYASSAVFKRLARGGGGYRVRYPKAGKHAEFDWSRQVLVLARGSKPSIIVHASSGKPSTPTVFGNFHFQSRQPGANSHGMYYSTYFIGGYAVHGYPDVPTYAASHGCIRIPIPSAQRVYSWIDLGNPIYVYR
jgi:hypothetical protein